MDCLFCQRAPGAFDNQGTQDDLDGGKSAVGGADIFRCVRTKEENMPDQKNQTWLTRGQTGYRLRRLVIKRQALRYVAKNEGAYLCCSGLSEDSRIACAK